MASTVSLEMSCFDEKLFTKSLKPTNDGFGTSLISFSIIDSTQRFLEENGHKYPSGTIVIADHQTSGRGRGINSWTSMPNALQFSFILKFKVTSQSRINCFQYYASLAMVEAINSLSPAMCFPWMMHRFIFDFTRIVIKWPNDIGLVNGNKFVKIGGVLISSSSSGPDMTLVIGIGLNLSTPDHQTSQFGSLSLWGRIDSCNFSRESLLAEFCFQFSCLLPRFSTNFGFFSSLYSSRWIHSQQILSLEGENLFVHITGIDTTGMLIARKIVPILGSVLFKISNHFSTATSVFGWIPRWILNGILFTPVFMVSSLIYKDALLLEPSSHSVDMSQLRIYRKISS